MKRGPELPPHLMHRPRDLREAARAALGEEIADFIDGGAGDEQAVARNEAAFAQIRLLPRVMASVNDPDLGTTVLGARLRAPLFVCPMGRQRLVHPDGELGTAAAASRAGIGYMLSVASSTALAEVAAAAPEARWFQLYFLRDRSVNEAVVRRAEAAGFNAFCVTLDAPVTGLRVRDLLHDGQARARVGYGDADLGQALSGYLADGNEVELRWSDLEWLRSLTTHPIMVKGVLRPEDAVRAVDVGVDAVVVSNHGGRQLARAPSPIEVCADVVAAIGGRIPVLVDSGVRFATDVIAALGLGATAVGIGRPVLWALACGGQAGVEQYLDALIDDLRRSLVLLGRSGVDDLRSGGVIG